MAERGSGTVLRDLSVLGSSSCRPRDVRERADSTMQLGEAIMGSHMLVMLVIGVALFATIIAGTVLATARGRYDRFGAELDAPRPDDPVPGGLPR